METHRAERVIESLRLELEEILNYELSDPRLISTSVTEVVLSPDGKKAHVRLHMDGTADEQRLSLEIIEKAKGYIRHLVAERIELYRTPDLRFDVDLPPELHGRAKTILRRIRRGRPKMPPEGEPVRELAPPPPLKLPVPRSGQETPPAAPEKNPLE